MTHNRFRPSLIAFIALAMAMLLTACGATSGGTADLSAADSVQHESAAYPAEGDMDTAGDGEDGRLIIRSKVLRLEVQSTADAVSQVRDLARTHSGSVSDMQVATDSEDWLYHYDEYGNPVGDGSALRGWITVRVPSDSYEDFIADVVELGTVKFQSESTSDVTQEHVDLSARLENLRAQEARLRDFFDAAKDVKEMLAIEQELGRVRGDIESLDAQVTYLERQAAMATVTIELTEPRAVVRPEGESWGFRDAITTGVRGAASVVTGVLTALLATSPLWLAGLVLFFPIRGWLRRRKAAKPAVPQPTPNPAPHPTETNG
ncbi:MAG TPA: DUF4349 domain-containing protein [Arachnia sp.]|nr:DUF4349 domain-containing protein [Arachnia sp.]